MSRPGVLRVGDRVLFEESEHTVVGIEGVTVRLHGADGGDQALLLPFLLASDGFALVGLSGNEAEFASAGVLESLPPEAVADARFWERHVSELECGLPADAASGTRPRPEYDPARTILAERERAKTAELAALGRPVGRRTLQRMRARYRAQGLLGLVDHRAMRPSSPTGRADQRVIDAIVRAIGEETDTSTGTRSRLMRRVEQLLETEHGAGAVAMPSRAAFYRLVEQLSTGRHTFSAATTRRQNANRPTGLFTPTTASRPGEQVQIDTTKLDLLAVLDDGTVRRPELTIAVDIATRTICAAVLRPESTKAVDAALLLAKMLVPEVMRPTWPQALAASTSRLPHARLLEIDARFEHAAAKPVIVPETIVTDHGTVYLSQTFTAACQRLGISVQLAHPGTPTDKGVVERTFSSINTLFCQHVASYTGRDVSRRGVDPARKAAFSLPELDDLLQEWVIHWQMRPHDGLVHPFLPGRPLSPNDAYALQVATSGYLPMPLGPSDYIELLPVTWRVINDYGIRIAHRTYDATELAAYRRQSSGVAVQRGKWEVHYDPHDLSHVFVRNHRASGWITAEWTLLPLVARPFSDALWRQARRQVVERGLDGDDQTAVARALDALLRRAGREAGESPGDVPPPRTATPLRPAAEPGEDDIDGEEGTPTELAKVIPFGVFDPFSEEDYR
ncbi:Mu transposase C-terminal domain-containing protein [Streptomyces europaeiscabiei]|uniref:Mu transposase C-terminal domain-containing protein n=1 Tax=Streptomyces europaeiscabiei TaxID=146819 RepID=UPI002E270568|nr:DDE-type integrase/transposase/recombinase [Streptomyces europaeiscabiei]